MKRLLTLAVSLSLLSGCAVQETRTSADSTGATAIAGEVAAAAALDALYADYWEEQLKRNPLRATALGDPRYHGALTNTLTPEFRAESERLERAWLARVRAIDASALTGQARLSYDIFVAQRERAIAMAQYPDWMLALSQMGNPAATVAQLGAGSRGQPFATVADAFLVPATTAEGVKLFVVLPSDGGVLLEAQRIVDGDLEATLDLAGVQLGEDRLVPGADVVHWLVARCTVGQCALQLGVLERALELTAEYARQRQQFGRIIGSFQAIKHRLARLAVEVDYAESAVENAVGAHESGADAAEVGIAVEIAQLAAGRALRAGARQDVQVHGGIGFTWSHPAHLYFRRAESDTALFGHEDDLLDSIAAGALAG